MKIINAKIFLLKIPFKFTFGHFLKLRFYSDSIIVKVISDTGKCGYGEGLARPYVTGETIKKSLNHIKGVLLPAIINKELPEINTEQHSYQALSDVNKLFSNSKSSGIIAWNASKSAVELAVIDCILKNQQNSLQKLLIPKTEEVTYSAVLTSGNMKNTIKFAKKFKEIDMHFVKIKVGKSKDIERIAIVRDIMGPNVSIRLDANGAFNKKNIIKFIQSVEKYNIESIEQPIKRGNITELAEVNANSSIPIMADESIVTLKDAENLIQHNACDFYNLRISKCGGIFNTLYIADFSTQKGMKIQLGCQVGETAILSAAGRHIAAHLTDVKFVEGSYSTHLLTEDISNEEIAFTNGGKASVLPGIGLGVTIKDTLLEKYSQKILSI